MAASNLRERLILAGGDGLNGKAPKSIDKGCSRYLSNITRNNTYNRY